MGYPHNEIRMNKKCDQCNGRGTVSIKITPARLMELRAVSGGDVNKINYIKEVRGEWHLSLKVAKELVEGVDRFLTEMGNTINGATNDNRT